MNEDHILSLISRTRVALFQHWPAEPDWTGGPIWLGTLADWWLSNPLFNLEQLRTVAGDLENGRDAKIGGGLARFTLRKVA